MGYDYDELYPGRFLKSGNFKGRDATLTIANILLEELEDQKGKKGKGILTFKETPKQLVLNRTNGECLKGMFGRDTGLWIGKRVTFYPMTVEAFGAPTLAIRVRGSPDLREDTAIVCKLGRKGDVRVMMQRTGQRAPAPAAKPAPPPAPAAPAAAAPAPIPAAPPPSIAPAAEPPEDAQLPGAKLGLPIIDVVGGESEEDATLRALNDL